MNKHKINYFIESFFVEKDLLVKQFSKNCIYIFYIIFFSVIAVHHNQFLSINSYSVDLDFHYSILDWYNSGSTPYFSD